VSSRQEEERCAAATFFSGHHAELAAAQRRSSQVPQWASAKPFAAARSGVSQGEQSALVSRLILSFHLSRLAPVSSRLEEESGAAASFVSEYREELAGTRHRSSEVPWWASAKSFAAARSGVSRE
jgi:hypothetical protein